MIVCGDGGVIGLGGDNLGPESCVGGEYAMEANEMEAGTRDQGSQALQEFQGHHHDVRGAIAVWGFELQDDVAFWCASQPFVAKGGTLLTEVRLKAQQDAEVVLLAFKLCCQF